MGKFHYVPAVYSSRRRMNRQLGASLSQEKYIGFQSGTSKVACL